MLSANRSRWTILVMAIAAGAFLVRLLVVAHTRGGNDLRIYVYFSQLPLHGINPYAALTGGAISSSYGNSPPVEVALFTALLRLHDSPTTLRVVFALADSLTLVLIGLRLRRPRRWRLGFLLFYAFNPFVLFCWTAFAEDKTLLFLGIVVLVLALEGEHEWLGWAAATALAVVKFLGVFVAPVLAVHSLLRRRWAALGPITAAIAVFALSNLPWFPESLHAFSRRDARLAINPPIHASPTLALARLGVYTPFEAKALTAAGLLVTFALFLRRRLDIREAVVWSIFSGYVFLPDDDFDRILLITLPLMLLVRFSARRWVLVWIVSLVATAAGVVATHGVPHAASAIADPLRTVFGRESTLREVVWMGLLTVLVIMFLLRDKRRRSEEAAQEPLRTRPA